MARDKRAKAPVEWLTRRQVAEILGVDEERVQAMDGTELHPIRRADRSWLYSPHEVAGVAAGGAANGVVTARVFAMFRDGNKTLADVAIETQQPATRIRELRRDYDDLAGFMSLSRDVVDGLRTALSVDFADGAGLLGAVRIRLDDRYKEGFREGRADAEDFGEVVNLATGERRRVTRDHPSGDARADAAVEPTSSSDSGAEGPGRG